MFIAGLLTGIIAAAAIGGPAMVAWALHAVRRARRDERRRQRSQRVAETGAMTAGLAHEIKNPLSTVSLNADLLAEAVAEEVGDREARERSLRRIDAIRREVDRLGSILQDFLRFAGSLHVEARPHDLNQLVEEMIDFYLPQAQHHGIRLRQDLALDPLPIDADANLLKQALLNLMVNATQAMAPGGPGVAVEEPPVTPASVEAPRELILRTRIPGGRPARCEVHVIDTGPGMPAELAAKIFEPYFTTKPSGSGLGLPTTRRLVEAHDGGALDVHSEPGVGTDFTISLPMRREQGAEPAG